jgi:UDP-N-acetyl-D-mannosaminuronic acid dehydrogenase
MQGKRTGMVLESLCVVGLGYIGLPTSIVFAEKGVRVFGVDINPDAVSAIARGEAPFVEAEIAEHLAPVVASGMLTASTTPTSADAIIIAVPTPFLEDKSADLSHVQAAGEALAPILQPGTLIVLESTLPPGATELFATWIREARPDLVGENGLLLVDIAHCPERVLPGRVFIELVTNDRIVGGLTPQAATRAKDMYSLICEGHILETDAKTAEMSKCVENSFRDVNIAFANELSLVCDTLGIDVWELIELANHHPRVNILNPGPGVGGHCIAIDPWFIVAADPENSRLIRMAREVNDAKPEWVIGKIQTALGTNTTPVIAALGLAFKPDIDDLRESPACEVVTKLATLYPRGEIRAVEPNVTSLPADLDSLPNVHLTDYAVALDNVDVAVLLVDHQEFKKQPTLPNHVVVIDTRGTWRAQ